MEAHLEVCPLDVISCPFLGTECGIKLIREEMTAHGKDIGAHLVGLLGKITELSKEMVDVKAENLHLKATIDGLDGHQVRVSLQVFIQSINRSLQL